MITIIALSKDQIFSIIKPRCEKANKGNFGKLLVIAGSENYRGAAYLSVLSALRCGTGIVSLASLREVINSVSSRIAECTYLPLEANANGSISKSNSDFLLKTAGKYNAVLIGCGMCGNEETKEITENFILHSDTPIIIDADGLNSIKDNTEILKKAKCDVIITPHIKEFSRLTKQSCDTISASQCECAEKFCKEYPVTLVLKSHKTVISSNNSESLVSSFGNVGLAKGGSGDLLAGAISAFRAQGYSAYESAMCGVFVQGEAANLCAKDMSYVSMLPSDVAGYIDKVFKSNNR